MTTMFYSVLADGLVAVHAAYIGFVLVGQLLILIGLIRGWGWVRNPWFRVLHLLAILVVGFEAVCGIDCPLTVWEESLRGLAGQTVVQGSFIGRLLHAAIFYDCQPWILDLGHLAFALLVLATFVLAPPRLPCGSRNRAVLRTAAKR
jgi:polyferredoxin